MRRLFTTLLLFAICPALAQAHNLGVDCKLKGDKVHVEAFYDDDSPGAKAKVEVVDAKDMIVASGITDAKGLWSFAAPAPGKYEVRVDAGAGHRAKASMNVPGPKADTDSADTPTKAERTISEGATRAEFTSFPWLKVTLGLSVIGGLCGTYLLVSLIRKNGSAETGG